MPFDSGIPSGPTADSPTDPNDYNFGSDNGGGSSFNYNSLIDSITGSIGPTLAGIGGIIGAVNGNPAINYGPQGAYAQQQQQYRQQQQNNTVMYILLVVFVLIILLGGVFLFTRK